MTPAKPQRVVQASFKHLSFSLAIGTAIAGVLGWIGAEILAPRVEKIAREEAQKVSGRDLQTHKNGIHAATNAILQRVETRLERIEVKLDGR